MNKTTEPDPHKWQKRAQDSWDAAVELLSGQNRKPYSGVSRLFYAFFQASKAHLLRGGHASMNIPTSHGDYLKYLARADRPLGKAVSNLFGWRLKADYCNDEVLESDANQLLARQRAVAQKLGLVK